MGLQKTFKNHFARDLIKDFNADTDNQYFIFVGKVDAWSNENSPDTLIDSVSSGFSAYRNALVMKRIERVNAFHVVTRYDWVTNIIYAQYDDTLDLSASKYYVMTDEYNLYKCISNGGGSKSTAKPTHTEPEIKSSGDDGYKWKFLGKVTENARKFLTDEYIPIEYVTNSLEDENNIQLVVQQTAVDGAIEKIVTAQTDGIYGMSTVQGHHEVGQYVQGSLDITAGTNPYAGYTLEVRKESPFTPQQQSDFSINGFDNYSVYTSIGRGADVGQIRQITGFFDAENGEPPYSGTGENATAYVVLNKPFERSLHNTTPKTGFRLLPPVLISGDGSSAEARTEVNDEYKITDCVVTNVGKNYTTAAIDLNVRIQDGGEAPTARAIIGPKGGHGSNIIKELQTPKVIIVMEVNKTEDGKIRATNQFRQFGIIKNPVLNDGTNRLAGEEVRKSTEIFISRPFGVTADYSFFANQTDRTIDTSTYKESNYIMGQESFATAKITEFRQLTGLTASGLIEVSDIEGDFVVGSTDKKLIRFIFGSSGGSTLTYPAWYYRGVTVGAGNSTDFQIGEIVTQHTAPDNDDTTGDAYISSGITGVTAEGVVEYWNGDNKELIIKVTSRNSFTSSSTAGFVRGNTTGYICFNDPRDTKGRLEDAGGEIIKQFSLGGTGGGAWGGTMEFVTFDEDNKQNYGRIQSISLTDNDENANPVYRTTTRLTIEKNSQSSGDDTLSTDSFTADAVIYQGDAGEKVSGRVAEWFTFGGFTGELHLTEVVGGFTGHTSGSNNSTYMISGFDNEFISGVSASEIVHGSGEVLYIENVRPVSRNIEQDEEFKIVVGF